VTQSNSRYILYAIGGFWASEFLRPDAEFVGLGSGTEGMSGRFRARMPVRSCPLPVDAAHAQVVYFEKFLDAVF
jgi:hypothetical protein